MKSVYYHSESRKPIVDKTLTACLRDKQSQPDSPVCSKRGPGCPSCTTGSALLKCLKTVAKEKVCMFSSCDFYSKESSEPLHCDLTDAMVKTFLEIKQQTQDDQVRISVADLEDAGDTSGFEKYYHRNCLCIACRTLTTKAYHSNVSLIRSVCDEQLILAIQNKYSHR